MISSLLRQTVTIQRRTVSGTDAHGNPTTTTATSSTVKGYLEPREIGDSEIDGRQETPQAQHRLVVAAGTDIVHSDRVVIGGVTYEVDGNPRPAVRATSGATHHLEVPLREVVR